jgi:hypothetical protein
LPVVSFHAAFRAEARALLVEVLEIAAINGALTHFQINAVACLAQILELHLMNTFRTKALGELADRLEHLAFLLSSISCLEEEYEVCRPILLQPVIEGSLAFAA